MFDALLLHPLIYCTESHGTGKEEALTVAAMKVLDLGQLMLLFDSLGNHFEIQAFGQSDYMRDDLLVFAASCQFVDKTPVDLERTDRKDLQITQR